MTKNKYIAPTISVVKIETASLLTAASWTPNDGGDRFSITDETSDKPYDDDSFGSKYNGAGDLWDED